MRTNATATYTRWIGILPLILMVGFTVVEAYAQPTFSKVFTPSTIGPGSVSTITFTITNGSASPVTGLSFTDVLPIAPGPMTIADPANASTTCDLGTSGSLTAPDGGSTITLSDAQIGGSQSCTVTVDVTASTPGVHTNPAITLTSSAGSSMSLPIDLTVDSALPGFSKSFAPSSVSLGGKSTLTFTIDNTLNSSRVGNLDFTDNLPTGMVVADPANASTDCVSASAPNTNITADPGTSVIILDANGSDIIPGFEVLPIGATCTVTVEVVTTGTGSLDNVTDELLADFTSAGKASATLESTVTPIALTKMFTDDPVPPGGTVTLDFTINNFDRSFSATGVAFTDDLTTLVPALAGLTFDSLLSNDCGGSVSGAGGTTIGFSGGTVGPESFCTISTSLMVPAGATPGTYTNTTSTITATVDGSSVVGNMASDDLFVEPTPILTMEFLEVGTLAPDPVINPGDDVVIRYTITNTSTTSMATDIAFIDELTDGGPGTGFLPFPVMAVLPGSACGGSISLVFIPGTSDRQGLSLTGGSLAAAPGAGATCTFDVTLTVPADIGPGTYLSTTEEITATVDGATRMGDPASDTVTVIAAPSLVKTFTDDPVAPGGTVTLEFTLSYPPDASGDATAITFTDDLAPVLGGLTANLPPTPDPPCGSGSSLTGSVGDTFLTLMGGTLMPGETCTFSVTLDVPAGAMPGSYTNTTSGVGATVEGLPATSAAASDDLNVSGLTFTKEFIDDPIIPGDTGILRFTIQNIHPTDDATITFFTDNLQANLTGLAATGPPSVNDCGGSLSGTTFLIYTGGGVLSGEMCTIDVEVLVPGGAADGTYGNITSPLSATQSGGPVTIDPAVDNLEVNANLLQLTKVFTDDPVAPGDAVTLEFTLTNLDAGQAASAIDFTDDLTTTGLSLIFDSVLSNDCGATVSGETTSMITVTGASLGIAGTCTIQVSLTVPGTAAPNIYTNTTSAVTGTIGGFAVTGDAASDDLEVINLLVFSKSFDGPTTATGTATLTFTITNPGPNTATDLGFTDDLNAVLTGLTATSLPANPCGAESSITGVGTLVFTGGEVPPMGGTCSFNVDVLVPASAAAGTFPNITSNLVQNGLKVADPATADLTVEPPPTFAKVFAPDNIFLQATSTLTFTIDNTASALAASSLDFSDTLPAGVVVADTPNASTTCSGGTLTATAAASVITYTGGSVAAGASCTVTVDVKGTASGAHVNTTGDLTSSSGNSGTASDTLTVAPPPSITVMKTDALTTDVDMDSQADPGDTITYTVTISNTGGGATGVTFTDLAANHANATLVTPSLVTTTQGSVTTGNTAGDTDVVVAVGDIAGSGGMATVTFQVTVDSPFPAGIEQICNQGTTSGSNFTNVLSDDPATTVTAGDPTCTNIDAVPDLTITKDDGGATVMPGNDVVYTLTYQNVGTQDATDVELTETVPDNTTFTTTGSTAGWSCTPDGSAGNACTLAIGDVAAGATAASATFAVTVVDPVPANTTEITNTASVADDGTNGTDPTLPNTATDTTPIDAMPEVVVLKSDALTADGDSDSQADPGDTITYTITITNNGDESATGVAFTDLAADHLNATLVDGSVTTSQGSVTTGNTAGDTDVVVAVGDIAGGGGTATVTFQVTVDGPLAAGVTQICNQGTVSDNFPDVLTDDPDVGGAADPTCTTVDAVPDLTITKDDGGATVMPGNDVVYTLTYQNVGTQDATGVELTETVPDNTTFTTTGSTAGWSCTPDASAGSTCTLALGAVTAGAAAASATFAVTVDSPVPAGTTAISNTASVADDGTNGTDPTLPNTATDTTPIDAMPEVVVLKSDALTADGDSDSQADPGDTITYTITITNNGDESATAVAFTDLAANHTNATLVATTVTTSQGSVTTGNTAGDTDVVVAVGNIAGGGGTATVTFQVTVDGPLPAGVETVCNQGTVSDNFPDVLTDDPDVGGAADPTCTTVDAVPDLTITKSDGNVTATPGDDVVYTLTYQNVGTQDATGVVITETVPDNTTFNAAASTAGWSCTPDGSAGNACTLAIGTVAAGAAAASATFAVTVDNPVEANVTLITNTASIGDDDANGTDPTLPNMATDTTPIDAMPEVSATKTDALAIDVDSDGVVDPGDTVEYTIVISNTGNEGADTVVLTDTPGVNTTLVVGSVVAPGATIVKGNTAGDTMVEVNFPIIEGEPSAPGTGTVAFRVVIDSPFPNGVSSVSNQGSVDFLSGDHSVMAVLTDDPDTPAPNDPTVTPIDLTSDLALTKTVDNPTPPRFSTVVFTLTVENLGPLQSGAVVKDLLPEGLTFISSNPADIYDAQAGFWKISEIAVGEIKTLDITARVYAYTPKTNVAKIEETILPDPDLSNNTASATVTPTLGVTKEGEIGLSIETMVEIPDHFELKGNYPNPFNPETIIPVGVPEASEVQVFVYDLLGRRVAELVNGTLAAGWHNVTWRATDLPTGIYFVRMQAGTFVQVQRVTLMK